MRSSIAGVAVAALLVILAGCSGAPPQSVVGGEPGGTPAPTRSTAEESSGSSEATPKSPRNDLEKGTVSHALKTGSTEVKINYSTRLAVKDWTVSTAKPLNVVASARMTNGSTQKIYLSKVTVFVDVRDDTGPIEAPLPLEDVAAITPGFLFKSPASYGQEFYIPALTPGAVSVTLRIRYEMLLENAAGAKNPDIKDYARQTVTDTLVIPIAAN